MDIWRKAYPVIAPEDAVEDLRRAVKRHMEDETFSLINFSATFTGLGETDVDVAMIVGGEKPNAFFPSEEGTTGADSFPWEEYDTTR